MFTFHHLIYYKLLMKLIKINQFVKSMKASKTMLKMPKLLQMKVMLKELLEKLEKWLPDQLMFMDGKEEQLLITQELWYKTNKEDLILMVTKEKILEMSISLLIKLIMLKNYPMLNTQFHQQLKTQKKWILILKIKDS